VWKEIRLCECKGRWTKKIGRANQGKVEESLFYSKVGGYSKQKELQSDRRGSSFAGAK